MRFEWLRVVLGGFESILIGFRVVLVINKKEFLITKKTKVGTTDKKKPGQGRVFC
jgi:hypothetical protein